MGTPPQPFKQHSRHKGNIDRANVRVLPAEGCQDPAPPIPAGRDWQPHEVAMWESVWKSPQADAYDDSVEPLVAAYIVHYSAILAGTAASHQMTEFRQLADRLGFTPTGLRALGWVIGGSE